MADQRLAYSKHETTAGDNVATLPQSPDGVASVILFAPKLKDEPISYTLTFPSLGKADSSGDETTASITQGRKDTADPKAVEHEPEQQEAYEEGKSYTLFLPEQDNAHEVTATAVSVTSHGALLLDDEHASEKHVELIQQISQAFERIIYPRETQLFGPPCDINRDGTVTILFTKFKNRNLAGFFKHLDLIPAAPNNPRPNLQEIVYVSLESNSELVLENITHEFQHLIFFTNKFMERRGDTYVIKTEVPLEERGINEGLSHLAEDLIGYGKSMPSKIAYYLNHANTTSLHYDSDEDIEASLSARGMNYLFIRYLVDRLGAGTFREDGSFSNPKVQTFVKALHTASASGYKNLATAYTEASGVESPPFEDLMADFATTMVLAGRGKPGSSAKYAYLPQVKDPLTGNMTGAMLVGTFQAGGKTLNFKGPEVIEAKASQEDSLRPLGIKFYRVKLPSTGNGEVKLKTSSPGDVLMLIVK